MHVHGMPVLDPRMQTLSAWAGRYYAQGSGTCRPELAVQMVTLQCIMCTGANTMRLTRRGYCPPEVYLLPHPKVSVLVRQCLVYDVVLAGWQLL